MKINRLIDEENLDLGHIDSDDQFLLLTTRLEELIIDKSIKSLRFTLSKAYLHMLNKPKHSVFKILDPISFLRYLNLLEKDLTVYEKTDILAVYHSYYIVRGENGRSNSIKLGKNASEGTLKHRKNCS